MVLGLLVKLIFMSADGTVIEEADYVQVVNQRPSQRPSGIPDLESLGLVQLGLLVAAPGHMFLQVVPALLILVHNISHLNLAGFSLP